MGTQSEKILEFLECTPNLPELDFEKLSHAFMKDVMEKEAFTLRNVNYDIINDFIEKKEAEAGRKESGVRQWNSTGDALYYYNSKVAWHNEDGGITVSNAGWKTQTTRTLIDGILTAMRNRGMTNLYQIYSEKGEWILRDTEGNSYVWKGSIVIKPDGSTDQEPFSNEEIERTVRERSKSISSQLRKDLKAIEQKILDAGDISIALEDLLDPEVYGEDVRDASLDGLMYEYFERKGYRNPGFSIDVIEEQRDVQEIKNVIPHSGNKIKVDYTYDTHTWRDVVGATEIVQIDTNMNIQDLKLILKNKTRLSSNYENFKKNLKSALKFLIKQKMLKEETGREYEAIR